jgi:acyl-CoA reductase-like NAD-dependent aldehyde dehydrogenase
MLLFLFSILSPRRFCSHLILARRVHPFSRVAWLFLVSSLDHTFYPKSVSPKKTGGAALVKAPEETPASPAALLRAFVDAGLPASVVGPVYGDPSEISTYLSHPVIRKVTFTGSTPIRKELAALAGQHMKPATMELGGHAPVILAEDADVARAVKTVGRAKFLNAGQVCISPTRFLVHNRIRRCVRCRVSQVRGESDARRWTC